jgi:GGDEF domain-containing protein
MRWTLRLKLTLGLAGIMTAILGLSLLFLTLSAGNRLVEDYRTFAIHVSDVAEAGLENAMISRNPVEITSVLQAINRRENIEGVIVFNKRGEIKYSVEPSAVDRIISMDDSTCRVCHDHPLTDRPQTIILPAQDGGRVLRVAKPILNQSRCQSCHQERVLGMLVTDFSLAEADQQVTATLGELLLWALLTIGGVVAAAIGFVHLLVARPLAVQKHPFPLAETQPGGRLTISLGIATFPEDLPNAQDLIHKANSALYRAKNAGRDRVMGA